MISCSHPHDRGQDLEAIICPGEPLCCYFTLNANTFFFSRSLLTPNTITVFNYIILQPLPTWNTNAGLISRSFVCSSFHLGYSSLKKRWHKPAQAPGGPAAFSLRLVLPSPLLTLDHWLYSVTFPCM